jgi:cyclohexanone monooxygenase
VRFGHTVEQARWDEANSAWVVTTDRGMWTTDILISANGALAEPSIPDLPGLTEFEGPVVHSAAWDHDLDLTGKRVAVVGTGASAIQIIPHLQKEASQLTVFQRTPAWVLPHTDRPITNGERKLYRRIPLLQKVIRKAIYFAREFLVLGMTKDRRFLRPLQRLAKAHIYSKVKDRDLRRKLMPRYELGCKRILLSDNYYPALASDNVELVTEGIDRLTPSAVLTKEGVKHEIDAFVLATGFKVTDNPIMEGLIGRDETSLAEVWRRDGMKAYVGTTIAGFPNMFMLTGPNTGIGHTSLLVMVEAQINYVLKALRYMDRNRVATMEVRPTAVDAFNDEVQRRMKSTVWTMGGCASWYLDDKGNNTTLWPDFTWKFRRATRTFDPVAYFIARGEAGLPATDEERLPA